MSALLSQSELVEITGYAQSKKQCEALASRGIPHTVDRNGRPVLTWAVFNMALLRRSGEVANDDGFNLEAI